MSDHKQHSAAKFADFEPSVTDAHVNESWDKIKYFLPIEKKRRGFAFFNKAVGFTFLSALLLCLGVIIFNVKDRYSERGKESISQSAGKESANVRIVTTEDKDPLESEKERNSLPNSGGLLTTTKADRHQEQGPSTMGEAPAGSSENRNSLAAISSDPAQGKGRELDLIPLVQTATPKDSAFQLAADSLTVIPLNTLNFVWALVRSDPKEISPETTKALPLLMPGPRNAILLEFFAGMSPTFTDIKNTDLSTLSRNRQNNLYGGLGLIYRLKKRWALTARITAGDNTMNYESETIGKRLIAQQVGPSMTAGPSTSTALYVQIQTKNSIQALYSANLQLGIGYSVFQRGRFAMDLSLQMGLRLSSYRYSKTTHISKDTLVYLQPTGSPPFANDITATEGKYDAHFNVLSISAVPVITFSYGITERTALIFKSAYFKQVSNTKINTPQGKYDLSQNNLYLGLGLRWKL